MKSTLAFAPERWHACTDHAWQDCDQASACYAYALDSPQYHWAVPGLGFLPSKPQPFFDTFNNYFRDASQAEFQSALLAGAESDGLVRASEPVDRNGHYLTALFFHDDLADFDFHWYRKDDDGTWSHKDGWKQPTNVDSRSYPILDPRDDPPPYYPLFGSFFYVPRSGVTLSNGFPSPR